MTYYLISFFTMVQADITIIYFLTGTKGTFKRNNK